MSRAPDFLYVVTNGTASKIGIAVDPEKRCLELGYHRTSVRPWLVRSWRRQDCRFIETVVKSILRRKRTGFCGGFEWFEIAPDNLVRIVQGTIRWLDSVARLAALEPQTAHFNIKHRGGRIVVTRKK